MSSVSRKKVADLPHGYVLYQLDYKRDVKGTLDTGDASRSLDDSRVRARQQEGYKKHPAKDGKPLKELRGDTKSFSR